MVLIPNIIKHIKGRGWRKRKGGREGEGGLDWSKLGTDGKCKGISVIPYHKKLLQLFVFKKLVLVL
jgi:hypothetical protein